MKLKASSSVLAICAAPAASADGHAGCQTVTFSDVGWTDTTATTAAISLVLNALGYDTEARVLSVPVTYTAMAGGGMWTSSWAIGCPRWQIDLVGLSDWADRKISELSGGMQQRVGLARAFATHAPILLMGEPFSALDPLIRTKLQDELLDLQSRLNSTIIFVSHNLDEAFKIGNRIAIMEGGRIVQCGTPREIFSAPANAYVAEFVAHMNPLGVLRAADVMEPGSDPDAPTVLPDAPLSVVMDAIAGHSGNCNVVSEGKTLGVVTANSVLNRLNRS